MERAEAVAFLSNVPVEVSLKWTDGKLCDGVYGPRVRYVLTDGRVMFLDTEVAAKINLLEPAPGECFWIEKARGTGKMARNVWKVWRSQPGQPATLPGESSIERDLRHSLSMTNGKSVAVENPNAPAVPRPAPHSSQLTQKLNAPPDGKTVAAAAVPMLPPAKLPPGPAIAATYSQASAEFLLMAGRAMAAASKTLASEGIAVNFDSRDIAAYATTLFIQAAREARVQWKPGEVA